MPLRMPPRIRTGMNRAGTALKEATRTSFKGGPLVAGVVTFDGHEVHVDHQGSAQEETG